MGDERVEVVLGIQCMVRSGKVPGWKVQRCVPLHGSWLA